MAVNTHFALTNSDGGFLCEGTDIRGGYFVIDKIDNIPLRIAQEGSLCYCQDDDTFYMYNSSAWVPANLGGSDIAVDDTLSTTSTNPVQNKVIASAIGDISSALEEIHTYAQTILNGGN